MRFIITQHYRGATPDRVIAAYTDPALYATFHGLTKVAPPEVLDREQADGEISIVLQMRFVAGLNAAARRVVDPAKLTWKQSERYDLAARTATVTFQPDNYADRFSCAGTYTFTPDPHDGTGTVRTISGDLRVRMLLVGGQVEEAFVSGLREHFAEEQPLVQRWLDAPRP